MKINASEILEIITGTFGKYGKYVYCKYVYSKVTALGSLLS
jgi:hypothetical protein